MSGWRELVDKPLCIDWKDLTGQLPDGCIDLLFLDPPYNIGTFCKMADDEYMEWCKKWIVEGDRILAPNGAFWVSHKDPGVLVDISREIARLGRKRVNWVTWDKYNAAGELQGFMDGYTIVNSLRSFQVMAEYLIYHADEGDWMSQCDRERGFIFEPLRAYLDEERKKAGVDKIAVNVACGFSASAGGMASRHYFSRSQWHLPTREHYIAMQKLFNCGNGNEYLKREYEDLKREYEDLRYTFNNPGKVSSVWQIPPARKNGHETPKPEALLKRIIETTSNESDLVCDFFAGSFTTAVVAQKLNRQWICCDKEERCVDIGRQRLSQPLLL